MGVKINTRCLTFTYEKRSRKMSHMLSHRARDILIKTMLNEKSRHGFDVLANVHGSLDRSLSGDELLVAIVTNVTLLQRLTY